MADLKYRFFYPIQIRFADTDAHGHVFFGTYFTYFDEAMAAYLQEIGFSWQTMLDSGVDMYYIDAGSQYKGRAFFAETLHVHTRISRIGNTSLTFEFAIYKAGQEALITTGHMAAVTIEAESGKPTRVPDALRAAVARYEGQN